MFRVTKTWAFALDRGRQHVVVVAGLGRDPGGLNQAMWASTRASSSTAERGRLSVVVVGHLQAYDVVAVICEVLTHMGKDRPKDLVLAVRQVVLHADSRVAETIKWQAPTFMYRGNIASFYPKATKHVSLMFHTGASLPDPSGLLEGDGATSRVAKFTDRDDLEAKTEALHDLVRAWISQKG